MKVKPVPSPNRRKSARRDEDVWKMRHTDALESLLSDLAYEVRNLLIPIPALTEILREEIDKIVETSTEDRQEFKERWSKDLNFLIDHTQRLMDRTKQVRLQTKVSERPLKTLVEGVLKSWASIAEKQGVSVECHGLESLPTVLAYEWRLQAVLFNVITRAIHVTQPGSSVTVSGKLDQARGAAIIEVKDGGPNVPLNVRDAFNRGDELDTAEIATHKAWDVLNLQEARRIGEIHGCRISIESSEGYGTTCSICFPLDNAIKS